jgi:ubiquinone/menaquinone biosynthesis C-methylase UbiE
MGRENDAWSRVTGKGVFPVEYASTLTTPWRRLIFRPSRLLRLLRLKPSDHVLEIGCGPGYFSPEIARFLKRGTLTLFDYQDGMLDIAEARLKERRLSNYLRQQGDAKALPFLDARFDAAFMVTVLGEVGDAGAALREALRVLKPGGRLSVTEQFGDPDFVSRRALVELAAAAGFALEGRFGPAFFYTCNFIKPPAAGQI